MISEAHRPWKLKVRIFNLYLLKYRKNIYFKSPIQSHLLSKQVLWTSCVNNKSIADLVKNSISNEIYIEREFIILAFVNLDVNNSLPSKIQIIKAILLATLESNAVSAYFVIHAIYLWLKLRPIPGEPSHSQPAAR